MNRQVKTMLCAGMRSLALRAGICGIVLLVIAPFSCKLTEEGIRIVSLDKTAPQIITFDIKQRSVLEMTCSEPMTLKEVVFRRADDADGAGQPVRIAYDAENQSAELTLSAPTEIGVAYELCGIVEDVNGNTLSFSLPFTGYNDNMPLMVFSEIRAGKGDKASPKFVELYVLRAGNTSGLELISGADGLEKKYAFPALSVQAGEYITVHYCKESDAFSFAVDERGGQETFALSHSDDGKIGVCDTSRDLWSVSEKNTRGFGKTDVMVLCRSDTNALMDAVLFAAEDIEEWSKTLQKELAAQAVAAGIWESDSPEYAANGTNATSSKTLCRTNIAALQASVPPDATVIPTCADDWIVVKASFATPGLPNSAEAFGN